jgi:hypothetical protein
LDSANVRRSFRRIATAAGLAAKDWTTRELRLSFVFLLPDDVPVEHIARRISHAGGSAVTETLYRKQLRPVIEVDATAMERIFGRPRHPPGGSRDRARPGCTDHRG